MQQRAIKTKELILATAIKLFARDGFQGTRIDDLAASAGVNRQRIYAYFGSKEKLFQAAMLAVFERANAEDDKLLTLGEHDLAEMTPLLLRHYLQVHHRHPELHRMIGWANLELKKAPQWMKDIKESSFSHLRALYAKGQEKGTFSDQVSFDVYIFALLAITYFHAANRITAAQTVSAALFSSSGAEQLVNETAFMLAGRTR